MRTDLVNSEYISSLIEPVLLAVDVDCAWQAYERDIVDDLSLYRRVVEHDIVGNYARMSEKTKHNVKLALQYALSDCNMDFGRFFNPGLPFSYNFDYRELFLRAWKALFDDEDYLVEACEIVLQDDFEEASRNTVYTQPISWDAKAERWKFGD